MIPFWTYIKQYKKLLFGALFLATINQFFSLLDPQIFRLIIDNYASKAQSYTVSEFIMGVILLLFAFVSVAFVSRTAKTFQDYFANVISQKVGASIYAKSVAHTFSLPFAIFEDRRSGEVLDKLQKARTDSQLLIDSFINILFVSLVSMLFIILYAFYVHYIVGLTYLAAIPIVGCFVYLLSKKIKKAQKSIVSEAANLAGSTTETLRNVELVKSLGLESQEISRLNEVNNEILNLELEKVKLIRKLNFVQGTIINALRASIIFVILLLVFYQSISLGEWFTLFIYSFFLFNPLSQLGTIAAQYQEAKASNEQLDEILKIPSQKKPKNPVKLNRLNNISFDKVSFTYETGNNPSVHDISLMIKNGETVAFVGPSGSGKTTLIKLLVGLYKSKQGRLVINGIDSLTLDYDDFRKKIGFVSQETQLFAGTIKQNLLFVNPDASEEECLNVLKFSSIYHIVERGGQGLNTKIGEGGIKLSGGEKQRLAIARALLRNPQLLIFDEATSSLDSLTEKEITKTIQKILKQKKDIITILVAHRLSTIAHSDTIYVLEKGRIVEKGTHSTLLGRKGLYYALWREQSAE
ncbi:ABC transporter ATP-binding protein [Candidatus Woesearchaeota archaeon CG10_big_fil_rev_8_21_14_0_10_30_7]|nr:MAG: ABC transporter ATP-binding protein [Candidatus Woesearchaeota archaeon CG10_big_fil_rev_8_21_14_0_10_30_7]